MFQHESQPSVSLQDYTEKMAGEWMASPSLYPWSHGKNLVWDFTCRDSLAASYVSATSKEAGKAAELAEAKKSSHYEDLASQYLVTPVAAETLGSWVHHL